MFKTILVPTDGSPLSDKAITAAIQFAAINGSEIVAMTVVEPATPVFEGGVIAGPYTREHAERMSELAQQYVDKVADAAKAANVPCRTTIAESFSPYEEIVKTAREFKCDIIFMASHGRKGLNRLFVGSETQKVLAHSDLPVLVFR